METVSTPGTPTLLAGRYRLGSVVGTGGMASVHRAWDERLERAVAVKVFKQSGDPMANRRFDEEARTLASLSCPGLVAVYDAGTENGQQYLVMQLVEGGNLRERIAQRPMPAADVVAIGRSLAETLAHVHAHGVIHRDVKPTNVLLDADLRPYLADFGISRTADSSRLTGAGQFVGTAGYLSPEQVRGTDAGPAADIYALGLVLLECLTGEAEYPGSDIESAVARISRSPRIPDGIPADLATLIADMTRGEPELRPAAAECAAILRRPATVVGPVLLPADPAPAAGTPAADPAARHHHDRRARLSIAAGLAGLVGLSWAIIGAAQPPDPAAVSPEPAPVVATSAEAAAGRIAANPPRAVHTEYVTVVATTIVTVPAAPDRAASGEKAESKEQDKSGSSGDDGSDKDDKDDGSDSED